MEYTIPENCQSDVELLIKELSTNAPWSDYYTKPNLKVTLHDKVYTVQVFTEESILGEIKCDTDNMNLTLIIDNTSEDWLQKLLGFKPIEPKVQVRHNHSMSVRVSCSDWKPI